MRPVAIAVLTMLAACGQPAPAAPQDPRAQAVLDRLPLIDACLALSPQTRSVTIDPSASRTLRLSGESGSFDCVVPDEAPDPANATVLPALNDPPADAIIFVRGPGENPGGECYTAPEVHDARGTLLGWLLDPEGC